MKKTKSIALWLVVAMLVSLLAACAAPAAPAPAPAAPAPAPAAPAPAPAAPAPAPAEPAPAPAPEKVELTYSFWGKPDEAVETIATWENFNASQDRIHVTVLPIPRETYEVQLTTMAAAGELPDMGIMAEGEVIPWAERGLLGDVSQMYAGLDSEPLEYLAFKYNGQTIAYSTANEILMLYYNRKMFDDAGIPYPPATLQEAWTWDEFKEVARQLTFDSAGRHPGESGFNFDDVVQYGAFIDCLPWQLEVWCFQNGGGYWNANGQPDFANPLNAEALQRVADLHLVDNVAKLSLGLSDDGIQQSILAGDVAMATGGQWNIGALGTAKNEQGLDYGVAVLPNMGQYATMYTGGPQVMFSTTEHPAEAMEALAWYSKEENNWDGLIATGIWMPVLQKYYTDEALMRQWVENPNFPPFEEYKSAVIDVANTPSVMRGVPWYQVSNVGAVHTAMAPVFVEAQNGDKTFEQVLAENVETFNAIAAGQ